MPGPKDLPHAVPAQNGKWHPAVKFPPEAESGGKPLIHPLSDMGEFDDEEAAIAAAQNHLDLCEAPLTLDNFS